MFITKFTTKLIGDKRRWRQYKARTRQLPESYRTAVESIERYLMYFWPADGDSAAAMCEDLVDLFEQSAADGTPIRTIVGDDPVEFVDTFVRNYDKAGYLTCERDRLVEGITRAEGLDGGNRS